MSEDRHIHIHIHDGAEGASEGSAAITPSKSVSKRSAPPTPKKDKRLASEYHNRVGKEMKRLKKAHPRMKQGSVMKKAHSTVKKSAWYKRRK